MNRETNKTNPLADFEAAIEKLGGVEEAMRQLKEFNRRLDAMPPERRLGIRQVEAPVLGDLVPPEEIPALLASSPGRGLFELERLHAAPEMAGRIGRIVTDALRDARVAPETRARLLWRYNHVAYYRESALSGVRGVIPFGLLDTEAGRKQYCKMKRLGYETIRCSSRVFFKRIQVISRFDWEKGRVKAGEILKKAIDDDSPAEFMLALGVVGKKLDARLLTWLLGLEKTKILDWLMENDETAQEWIDPRRVLFFKCANFWDKSISESVEQIARTSPGTIASCTDALGRNLLWYTLYNRILYNGGVLKRSLSQVEELLIRHGADPDAETVWGVSWRHMKRAMEEEDREFAFYVNGVRRGKWSGSSAPQGDGDEHRFRIVHGGTGLAMEWAFPKHLFPSVSRAFMSGNTNSEKGVAAVIVFSQRNGEKNENRHIYFRRGPDRLFHFAESNVLVTKSWMGHV